MSGVDSSSRHSATRRRSPPESVAMLASHGGRRSASAAISSLRSSSQPPAWSIASCSCAWRSRRAFSSSSSRDSPKRSLMRLNSSTCRKVSPSPSITVVRTSFAASSCGSCDRKPMRRCVRLRRRGATPHRERQRTDMSNVAVVLGERLARYGFGDGHPFGPDRHGVFVREFEARGLDKRVRVLEPRTASEEELRAFHSPAYLEFVRERSESGQGFLDAGDTPAFRGVYEAAACVVGATLSAVEAIMQGECRRAFVPIAGLHHAGRERAAGFCVFNDCGVAIELVKRQGLKRVGYG